MTSEKQEAMDSQEATNTTKSNILNPYDEGMGSREDGNMNPRLKRLFVAVQVNRLLNQMI